MTVLLATIWVLLPDLAHAHAADNRETTNAPASRFGALSQPAWNAASNPRDSFPNSSFDRGGAQQSPSAAWQTPLGPPSPRRARLISKTTLLRGRPVINELDYDQGDAPDGSFLEIANLSPSELDLTDYVLRVYYYFPLSTSLSFDQYEIEPFKIPPGGYFVLCSQANQEDYCDQHLESTNFSGQFLPQTGPAVVSLVFHPTSSALEPELVDSVCYLRFASGGDVPGSLGGFPLTETRCIQDPEHDSALGLSRVPSGFDSGNNHADFRPACITPGLPNAASSRDCTSRSEPIANLVVNEVALLAGQFIEIKNIGTTPAHLADYDLRHLAYNWWSLLIDRREDLPDVVLEPGNYFVLCADASTLAHCDHEVPLDLNEYNGIVALIHNPASQGSSYDPELDILIDSFVYQQFYEPGLPEPPQGSSWTEGEIQTEAMSLAELQDASYSRQCDGADSDHNAEDFRLSPRSSGSPNDWGDAPSQPCGGRGHCFGSPPRIRCACDDGFAGPRCSFSCREEPGCTIESQSASDGSTLGLTAFGTTLFPLPDLDDPTSLVPPLKAWILDHRDAFEVSPFATLADLEISAASAVQLNQGDLKVFRLTQTYRGLPVAEPYDDLLLSGSSAGIISYSGAVADSSKEYRGLLAPLSSKKAEEAFQRLFDDTLPPAIPRPLTVTDIRLEAHPLREELVYSAIARSADFGVGRAMVSAADGELVALYGDSNDFPGTPTALQLRTERADVSDPFSSDVSSADTALASSLVTGEDIPGIAFSGNFRLASPFAFIKDLSGSSETLSFNDALEAAPLVSSATPLFDAQPGSTSYFLVDTYYKVLSLHRLVSSQIAKQWESSLKARSTFPVGEFEPRVAIAVGKENCPNGAPACAGYLNVGNVPQDSVFYQRKGESGPEEPLGKIVIEQNSIDMPGRNTIVLHEFGHVVDLFLGPGQPMPSGNYCNFPGLACLTQPECVADTDDEIPPLVESIAQLFAIWAYPSLFSSIEPDSCEVTGAVSRGGNRLPHNDTCRASLVCSPFVPKPSCLPAVYDPAVVHSPGYKQVPCQGQAQEMGLCEPQHWHRDACENLGCIWEDGIDIQTCFCPTGGCDYNDGYRVDAAFQAYWELITGEVCDLVRPFSCSDFSGLEDPDIARELAGKALFYALRKRPLTYRALFQEMAAYYSCAQGGEFYEEYCDIVAHHGLYSCGPQAICQICGNGELEPGEECDDANTIDTDSCLTSCVAASCGDGILWDGVEDCDGSVLGGNTCESLGFGGGSLGCSDECAFDTSACSTTLPSCESGRPGEPGCPCLEDDFAAPGDGPGSLLVDGLVFGNEGFTPAGCIDGFDKGDEIAICHTEGGRTPSNVCVVCEGDFAGLYGCPCATDADCNSFGKSIRGNAIPMACLGTEEQGWSGIGPKPGTCLPDVDPNNLAAVDLKSPVLEEFLRTTWICKQNCSSLTAATGGDIEYFCDYGEHFPVATCHDNSLCEVDGQRRNPSGGGCVDECDPRASLELQQEQCHTWGYPLGWGCAAWSPDRPRCAPPDCVEFSSDLSGVCTYFMVNANSGR